MNKKRETDIFNIIISLVIIGAFLVAVMVAMLSELGVHPDEWDVKECLDWGMSHWIWPDMRADDVAVTYSWYGYTKVCNNTPYFLIAGKVAYLISLFMKILPYYRVPNLLLSLFITVFMLRRIKTHRFLALAYCVSVQIWYIFSYVTADAMDFVWAFLALYVLADENSILWKALAPNETAAGAETAGGTETAAGAASGGKNRTSKIIYMIALGVLYGLILLGKPYYFAVLVLTFYVLLMHLIRAEKELRKGLWSKYIFILLIAGLIFAGRMGIEYHYYGTDRAQVKQEMQEIYSSDDKKPSTPVEEQSITYHMYSKGYSLTDLFKYDEKWGLKSFRSFVSARITTEGDDWYYIFMAAAYIVIFAFVAVYLYREERLTLLIGTLLMVGGVVASVLNSYLIDSQAQGRYLLPAALIFAYMVSRVPQIWNNRIFKICVLAAACASIMYFGLFDSRKLIDLGYVRTLIGELAG